MVVLSPRSSGEEQPANHVPGEIGIWVFILGDMLAFALFFGVFIYYRVQSPMVFAESSDKLSVTVATVNTVVLLSGSLLVAAGLQAARKRDTKNGAVLILSALLCGCVFIALKAYEYGEKLRFGLTPTANDFFMLYYVFTGIHLMHVFIGIVTLLFMWRHIKRGILGPGDMRALENGASYWHLVDLLWVVLFPLFYLMG